MIRWMLFIIVNIPLFYYSPWIWNAWRNSPLDKDGPFWIIAALLALLLNIPFIFKAAKSFDKSALILILFSCLMLALGEYLQIRIFSVTAAFFLSLGLAWLLWGWDVFLILIPVYLIAMLSLPTTSYIIWYLLSKVHAFRGFNAIFVKSAVALVFFMAGWIYAKQKTYYLTRLNGIYWCSFIFFIAVLIFSYIPSSQSPALNISLSVEPLAGWFGEECKMTGIEAKVFSEANASKYNYYRDDGYFVSVISFRISDNVHSVHPPDYCLRGAGWTIISDSSLTINFKAADYMVRRIIASMNGFKMIFYSWYSSDTVSTWDYKVFRLKQKSSSANNWKSYLVSINVPDNLADSEKTLIDFIGNRSNR